MIQVESADYFTKPRFCENGAECINGVEVKVRYSCPGFSYKKDGEKVFLWYSLDSQRVTNPVFFFISCFKPTPTEIAKFLSLWEVSSTLLTAMGGNAGHCSPAQKKGNV